MKAEATRCNFGWAAGACDCRRAISAAGAGAAGRAPTILDDFGLEAGLRWLRRGFRRAHRHPGDSRIQAPGPPSR